MKNEINLLRNNDKREWKDLEWIDEFYYFLQGKMPKEIKIQNPLILTADQAFGIIWYLQEHFPLLPDHIEKCDVCNTLYDSYSSGFYTEAGNENGQHHFCSACDHLAPYEIEN